MLSKANGSSTSPLWVSKEKTGKNAILSMLNKPRTKVPPKQKIFESIH